MYFVNIFVSLQSTIVPSALFWSFPFKSDSELVQTNKVSSAFGRNLPGHEAEVNLPRLGEKPQRAWCVYELWRECSYDQGLAKELFLSELLLRLVQRRAQAFRVPSRNETQRHRLWEEEKTMTALGYS